MAHEGAEKGCAYRRYPAAGHRRLLFGVERAAKLAGTPPTIQEHYNTIVLLYSGSLGECRFQVIVEMNFSTLLEEGDGRRNLDAAAFAPDQAGLLALAHGRLQ